MTYAEKDTLRDFVISKYGSAEIFPLKVVETRHGYWVDADELV